ncbi:efflux RND transporter periplasmic adaptor subunit [Thalassolituus sp.]|jgi:RND family efflux transporter MFP subunit|uniref:efflux RND transporter periplasmic adaptor subunit n=1 Tax=Thalassolituus sp. TaxID=2030822 RepID=UPI00261B809C|nr:efflux RND transporter periplasmic adaptor subunit [uncultured Thalassolituus sp.]
MKKFKFIIIGLILLLAAGAGGYYLYINAPKPVMQERRVDIPIVPFTQVSISSQAIPVMTRGRVASAQIHKVASQVSGLVTDLSPNLTKGALIKKGDLLAQIDDQPIILDIAQKKANLAQTRLKLEETEANARVARRQAGKNSSDFARFVPQLEYATSQVEAAQAALDYANRQLENTQIIAPIDGKIVEVYINRGDLIQTGTQVAVIYGMDKAEVRLPLSDHQLAIIGAQEAYSDDMGPRFMPEVTLRDYESGDEWAGYLVRTDGERSRNQLLYAVAQVSGPDMTGNQGRYLVPGSFVEAEIRGREIRDLRILPREVVQPGDSVWMINADNTIQLQPVDIRYRGKDQVYIDTLLPPGTRIISGNFHRLVEGMTVSPANRK